MAVGAILLAAGESSRMGRLKALLPWGGRTLLEYQLDQVAASRCATLVVVLGHEATRLRGLVHERPGLDLSIVENLDYRSGKSSSIRLGVGALRPDLSAILVLTVDQPRPSWVLDRLIGERERAGALVAVPANGGRRGHPPIFASALRDGLLAVSESEQGLRAVLRRHAADLLAVEMNDPVVGLNLNSPEEYEAGRALSDSGK